MENDYDLRLYLLMGSIALLVLLVVLKPLYKLSKSIEGLFLIFVDSIFQTIRVSFDLAISLLCTTMQCNFGESLPLDTIPFVAQTLIENLSGIIQQCILGLLVIIALNRFHAIFLPFSYNKFWKPRNKKALLLINVLLAICFHILNFFKGEEWSLYWRLNLPYYALCVALPFVVYLMILVKFCSCCSNKTQMDVTSSVMRQDRIRIAIVCFLTILPDIWRQFSSDWLDFIAYSFFDASPGTFRLGPEKGVLIWNFMLFIEATSKLTHIIGLLVLNKQFRQLLRAHILSGIELLRKIFKFKLIHSFATVNPSSQPTIVTIVMPAPEAGQIKT